MDNDLKKLVAVNMQLSKEFSNLKKEFSRTRVSVVSMTKQVQEKSSVRSKLNEDIAKLECTVEKLEKERFSDSLIDLNKAGNFSR